MKADLLYPQITNVKRYKATSLRQTNPIKSNSENYYGAIEIQIESRHKVFLRFLKFFEGNWYIIVSRGRTRINMMPIFDFYFSLQSLSTRENQQNSIKLFK